MPTTFPPIDRHHLPKAGETLDIESTAEAAVMSLRSRFALVECRFDPRQGIALAQRLTRAGVNMVEWPQSSGNLSLMGGNLLELITRRQIVAYPDDALRQAILKTGAIENSRGWRLGKTKAADRVDLAIALAMAAIAITQAGGPAALTSISRSKPRRSFASNRVSALSTRRRVQALIRAAAAFRGRFAKTARKLGCVLRQGGGFEGFDFLMSRKHDGQAPASLRSSSSAAKSKRLRAPLGGRRE
jgi:hypothetical protein